MLKYRNGAVDDNSKESKDRNISKNHEIKAFDHRNLSPIYELSILLFCNLFLPNTVARDTPGLRIHR